MSSDSTNSAPLLFTLRLVNHQFKVVSLSVSKSFPGFDFSDIDGTSLRGGV